MINSIVRFQIVEEQFKIKYLDHESFKPINDKNDIKLLKDFLGKDSYQFESFLVKTADNKYLEVYGIKEKYPTLENIAYLLYRRK